jgi:hypothetical protein
MTPIRQIASSLFALAAAALGAVELLTLLPNSAAMLRLALGAQRG